MTWLEESNMKQQETALLGKAGVALKQLASGLPGPHEPVQSKDVGEKLLEYFGEVKHG